MAATTRATLEKQPRGAGRASQALTTILGAWIRAERSFQRSKIWPVSTPIGGVAFDRQDYTVLRELIYGGPRRLGDLARALSMTASHTSRVIDTHVRWGLLIRTIPDDDRRVAIVDVSPQGREIGKYLEETFRGLLAARLANFTTAEIEQFAGLFNRFADEVVGWAEDYNSEQQSESPGRRGRGERPVQQRRTGR